MKNSFILSFDSWSTDRKTVSTQLEYQVDIGSAQVFISPKYLKVAHQTEARIGPFNKEIYFAIFDNLNVRKNHVDINGVRYPRDGISIHYALNVYIDQIFDLKLFYKEFVCEELINLFISYTDMKTEYPIQIIDIRVQVDHDNPKKIQLFEDSKGATNNARLFLIITRHREFKMI